MRRRAAGAALLIGLGLWAFAPGVMAQTVVTTHAVFGEFVRMIAGDAIEVVTMIPSGFCPAHYDLGPRDLAAVLDASLILYSGFEPWIETLADAAGSGASVVQLPGSWSTPDAAIGKVEAICDLLMDDFPELSDAFSANADAYIAQLTAFADDLLDRAASLEVSQIPVVCMAWQVDFVGWLGFPIAATYGLPEDLSLRDLVALAAVGRDVGAALVVDNLQSGIDFGAKLAREIGAVHVVLSNFPGAMPRTATVLDLFASNAAALFSAIEPME